MKTTYLKSILAVAYVTLLMSCSKSDDDKTTGEKPVLSNEEMIKRGRYLVTISGCNDCHSPKVLTATGPMPDTTRLLSGHPMNEPLATIPNSQDWILFSQGLTAFVGPWGVSYAANLTPDDSGIGNWKLEQFKTALRKGKYKGLESSRSLLPPMPWQMYRNMTDDDLTSVFQYLKSLRPVSNVVPAYVSADQLKGLAEKLPRSSANSFKK